MSDTVFLGEAKNVGELIKMIQPYSDFDIYLDGCHYQSSIEVYCNKEKKYIELN